MITKTFETEAFFEKYEFSRPYLLSPSDCETITISELIALGGGDNQEFLNLRLGYTEATGSLELREHISTLYSSTSPDQIITLGAPVEGIYLTLQTLISSNDHVIIQTPAYDALINTPLMKTNDVSYWEMIEGDDNWSLNFDALEKLVKPNSKLLVINFPHNPTGFLPTASELKRLASFANDHGLWIFSDEMYKGLELFDHQELPSMSDLYDKSITLRGLSKTIGLPGLRLGWLTVKDKPLFTSIVNYKYYTTLCATKASEYLGIMGLKAFKKIAKKNVSVIESNIEFAAGEFKKMSSDFKWFKPMAASVSVVKTLKQPAEALCIELAEKHGIVLLPSKYMGLKDNFFRIGLGRANFKEGMRVFSALYS